MKNGEEKQTGGRLYRYPAHMKTTAKVGFWSLRDLFILGLMLLPSALAAAAGKVLFPLGFCLGYAVLSLRPEEDAVSDHLFRILRYLLSPRLYVWRPREGTDGAFGREKTGRGNAFFRRKKL